jgi:D-tyrosyl-tRNA(Tyr) deacylase
MEDDMRAVVTRVRDASVRIEDEVVAEIGRGLLVLLGVAEGDGVEEARTLARKVADLRIFPDDHRPLNRSVIDVGGEVLAVSQFTLLADTRKGRRPSFVRAAGPEVAEPLYLEFVEAVRARGLPVQTGRFGATMLVSSVNDGPVTVLVSTSPEDAI